MKYYFPLPQETAEQFGARVRGHGAENAASLANILYISKKDEPQQEWVNAVIKKYQKSGMGAVAYALAPDTRYPDGSVINWA